MWFNVMDDKVKHIVKPLIPLTRLFLEENV